jgi:hypothetical protein
MQSAFDLQLIVFGDLHVSLQKNSKICVSILYVNANVFV